MQHRMDYSGSCLLFSFLSSICLVKRITQITPASSILQILSLHCFSTLMNMFHLDKQKYKFCINENVPRQCFQTGHYLFSLQSKGVRVQIQHTDGIRASSRLPNKNITSSYSHQHIQSKFFSVYLVLLLNPNMYWVTFLLELQKEVNKMDRSRCPFFFETRSR